MAPSNPTSTSGAVAGATPLKPTLAAAASQSSKMKRADLDPAVRAEIAQSMEGNIPILVMFNELLDGVLTDRFKNAITLHAQVKNDLEFRALRDAFQTASTTARPDPAFAAYWNYLSRKMHPTQRRTMIATGTRRIRIHGAIADREPDAALVDVGDGNQTDDVKVNVINMKVPVEFKSGQRGRKVAEDAFGPIKLAGVAKSSPLNSSGEPSQARHVGTSGGAGTSSSTKLGKRKAVDSEGGTQKKRARQSNTATSQQTAAVTKLPTGRQVQLAGYVAEGLCNGQMRHFNFGMSIMRTSLELELYTRERTFVCEPIDIIAHPVEFIVLIDLLHDAPPTRLGELTLLPTDGDASPSKLRLAADTWQKFDDKSPDATDVLMEVDDVIQRKTYSMHGTATVLRRCTVTNGDKCCVKLAVHPVTRTPESDFIQRGWQAGVTQGLPRLLAAGTQKLEHFNRIRSSKGGALEYREIRMTVMEEYTRVPRGLDGDQYKKILLPVFCGHDEMIRSAGVLHRDIKPENIMRREDGTGVLIDYDLASFIRTPDDPHSSPFELTARHRTGTPPFMSIRLLEEELPDGEPFLGNSEADDLDSKFYVLLDFCHQGGIDAALGLVPLMSWPAIAQKKKEFIFNGGRWDEGIRDNCLPLWKEWGHEMALQLAYLARAGDGLIAARSSVISTAKAFKSGTVAHVKRYEDALDEEAVAREKWGKVNEGFCGAFRAIYWPSAEGPIETAFSG